MLLTLKERFSLPSILPTQGGFTKLVIKNDIIDKIKITQEEIKEFEIESNGQEVKWNTTKEKDLEVDFTELESNLIKECLSTLDKEEKLNDETFGLYNKFNK